MQRERSHKIKMPSKVEKKPKSKKVRQILEKRKITYMDSNIGLKEEVILDPCLGKKRVNMDSSGKPSASYFYLHLPIIQKLRGLIPFTYFEIDLLATISDTPS